MGNDRQALNVNTKINDNQWHTILVKRDGPTTLLSIDNGLVSNSTITHSADLYFGGSTPNEYQASSFYFGGKLNITRVIHFRWRISRFI